MNALSAPLLRLFVPFVIAAALGARELPAQNPAPQFGVGLDVSPAAIDAFVDAARTRTLAQCAQRGIDLPDDFVAWVDADRTRRASVYGCRAEPLSVLLMLRSLEIDLGEEVVRERYPQLAIAFAVQRSYVAPRAKASGWNDGDGAPAADALPDVTPRPRLELRIPGDPRVRVDTKDATRALDRDDHIVNFLEDHAEVEVEVTTRELPPLEYDEQGRAKPRGKARTVTRTVKRGLVGADVIASAALQQEFHDYMAAHGHGDVRLDCGDGVVHWRSKAAVKDKALRTRIAAAHELFHAAYRNKGRMPAERDRAPTPAESMAWFVRNDRHPFSDEQRAARKWPRFPLDAPWPLLLMLAADDQPLREREQIWTKFRDDGELRTYGEYIGGIAQQFDMQSARRVSPFAFSYGSIQMMWKDGGVCGTMGNIGARTWRICGVPASTAGQPGHCAIVLMERDEQTGAFRCRGGQYAAGGDEVTTVHAGWNYDDRGGRRKMVFHQSVAWGINHGHDSFVDTLVMQRIWNAAPADVRARGGVAFVEQVMARNPFGLAAIDAALRDAADVASALHAFDAFAERFDALDEATRERCGLYRQAVRDLAHARVLALPPPPADAAAARALAVALDRQGCEDARLLARTWRAVGGEQEFTRRCVAHVTRYVALPPEQRSKRAAQEVAGRIKTWAKSVKAGAARKAWADELLAAFAGKEALRVRRKVSLDPAVAELCKLAGRDPPDVAAKAAAGK